VIRTICFVAELGVGGIYCLHSPNAENFDLERCVHFNAFSVEHGEGLVIPVWGMTA